MEENKEVYIDTNVFIYTAISTRTKGEISKEILSRLENDELVGFTSTLTFDEIFWNIKKERGREDAIKAAKAFLHLPNLIMVDVTCDIITMSLKLLEKYAIDPRDAIHVACALSRGITTIISDDSDFDRVKEIKRKSLKQFKA